MECKANISFQIDYCKMSLIRNIGSRMKKIKETTPQSNKDKNSINPLCKYRILQNRMKMGWFKIGKINNYATMVSQKAKRHIPESKTSNLRLKVKRVLTSRNNFRYTLRKIEKTENRSLKIRFVFRL